VKRLLVFVFVLLSTNTIWADEDYTAALDYLKQMGQALNDLNYHGTLVYLHNDQIETMKLIHKKDQDGESERLVHLSGAPREVLRKGDMVTCYLPDRQSVVKLKRRSNNHLLARLKADFKNFVDYYSFHLSGNDRVAGRSARIIFISPKDEFRYGYRLWLDQESNLLLKSVLVDDNEQVLEQMMFTNLTIVDSIPNEDLQPGIDGEKFTWHMGKDSDEKMDITNTRWKINNMPNGFTVTGYYRQPMPNSDNPADHMVISDGLASISVYFESSNAKSQGFVGASSMGAIHVFGSIIDNYKITVVGEVPELTVRAISESLQYSTKELPGTEAMAGEGE
jgi:sigma-E factor negative regulatory protein RseB